MLELTFPGLAVRQSFTPTDQEQLNTSDTDLGSSAPALLGEDRIVLAGKDGIMRAAGALAPGRPPAVRRARATASARRGTPAAVDPRRRRAVHGAGRLAARRAHDVFVADENGTAAYVLRGGRLYRAWENATPGTSPVMAGGLLYVYDPSAGGINVYRPGLAAGDRHAGVASPATGTARSWSTDTSSSPRATPTTTAQRHARDLLSAASLGQVIADSLAGQLLLASPSLLDPNFARTVVLIGAHSEDGAIGVVLNRPSTVTVGEAVPQLQDAVGALEPVYVGGPVQPSSIVFVAEFLDPTPAGLLMLRPHRLPRARCRYRGAGRGHGAPARVRGTRRLGTGTARRGDRGR